MTTQHAKSNAREGDGVADRAGLLARLKDHEAAHRSFGGKHGSVWATRLADDLAEAIAALQAQQGVEPVGFVLVPRQITRAMGRAFASAPGNPDAHQELQIAWTAMLAAAQTGAPR